MISPSTPPRLGNYILTHSKTHFYPFDPRPEEVVVEDIWWSLARINRFNGHTKVPYTVAEHSLHCMMAAPEPLRCAALLHDAAEAYVGDVLRPIKNLLYAYIGTDYAPMPSLEALEQKLLRVIFEALEVPWPNSWDTVTKIDHAFGAAELAYFFDLSTPAQALLQPTSAHAVYVQRLASAKPQTAEQLTDAMALAFEAVRHG